MGFPRTNDTARIYRDKDRKTFFIIFTCDPETPGFGWGALAN
jgi:hypothetical protein